MNHKWEACQSVILDGKVVTIDRVTPSGRAVIGDRTFNPDGRERRTYNQAEWRSTRGLLSPATPQAVARLEKRAADEALCVRVWAAINRLERHARWHYPSRNPPNFTPEDCAKLADLIAAIDKLTPPTPEQQP